MYTLVILQLKVAACNNKVNTRNSPKAHRTEHTAQFYVIYMLVCFWLANSGLWEMTPDADVNVKARTNPYVGLVGKDSAFCWNIFEQGSRFSTHIGCCRTICQVSGVMLLVFILNLKLQWFSNQSGQFYMVFMIPTHMPRSVLRVLSCIVKSMPSEKKPTQGYRLEFEFQSVVK